MLQIEVLGASLPWRDILTNEGPGTKLIELAKSIQMEINPFLSRSNTRPFDGTSANVSVSEPVQSSSSSNNWLDLLTGEDGFSNHIDQPVTERIVDQGSEFLDFLDQAAVEYQGAAKSEISFSSSVETGTQGSSSQQYINCLKSLVGPQMVYYYYYYYLRNRSSTIFKVLFQKMEVRKYSSCTTQLKYIIDIFSMKIELIHLLLPH